ncbi:MAG TPA: GNAT family N-acetyltransferase [Caproicibacter sp.]|nr:GNAT family N-acetyltransferase [Caproicibacter sp.]
MVIRKLNNDEIKSALDLAWNVFLKFEAPDYSQDGVDEFNRSIHDPQYLNMLQLYGAFDGKKIVGMIATRSSGKHIALFFVDGKHQGQGVGRKLFTQICAQSSSEKITVNSSPFAVPIYHHLGFTDTDTEQITNGLRYTPMEYNLEKGLS